MGHSGQCERSCGLCEHPCACSRRGQGDTRIAVYLYPN